MCPKCSSIMSSKLNQNPIISLVTRSLILQLLRSSSLLKCCCGWRDFSSHIFIRVFDTDSGVKIMSKKTPPKCTLFTCFCVGWMRGLFACNISLSPQSSSRSRPRSNLSRIILTTSYVDSSCIEIFFSPLNPQSLL